MNTRFGIVIVDGEGRFVNDRSFKYIDGEWFYCSNSGRSDGMIFYSKQTRAEEFLKKLQSINEKFGFNKEFHVEKYDDVWDIPIGEFTIERIEESRCAS